jgi:hypothetical protein
MKKACIILLVILVNVSCLSFFGLNKITRMPQGVKEFSSTVVGVKKHENIFEQYMWTYPDLTSRKIGKSFIFSNEPFTFETGNGAITVIHNGSAYTFPKQKSNKVYMNLSTLESTTVLSQRWVPKTVIEVQTVPVMKTRQVPVTTFGPDGIASTTFQTEFYTDFETRHVPVTKWEWENYPVTTYYFPVVEYCQAAIGNKYFFIIYETGNANEKEYYLQNSSYLLTKSGENEIFGSSKLALVFADTDSNGSFFDPTDMVLFNTWNPFDRESSYSFTNLFVDNRWYTLNALAEENFLYFEEREKDQAVFIGYENDRYLNEKNTGKVTFKNLKGTEARIFINGNEYNLFFGNELTAEYGKYRIRITNPGYLDYEEVYTINGENPHKVIEYALTEKAGTIGITNIFAQGYIVEIRSEKINKFYLNAKQINLPAGKYHVSINVHGFLLEKEITVTISKTSEIDYEQEIMTAK